MISLIIFCLLGQWYLYWNQGTVYQALQNGAGSQRSNAIFRTYRDVVWWQNERGQIDAKYFKNLGFQRLFDKIWM